ncbi:MAG TPA: gluconate 2-dehydrogenase subunit 3 family protein [Aquabacterium sp.]|nr:gluconate 2-dehydrogenase subunit 3 family protein [Aquabacterium sp.]
MNPRTARPWPVLPQLRRRWFLRALCAGGLLGWLAQVDARVARARPGRAAKPVADATDMPAAWTPFLDHLIPADAFTPAASALAVPQQLWRLAQQDPPFRQLIEWNCVWLDRYGDGYAGLRPDEREVLMQWMAQAPWEAPQRRFFHLVREQAFMLYYGDPRAWSGLSLTHPPQPQGYALE